MMMQVNFICTIPDAVVLSVQDLLPVKSSASSSSSSKGLDVSKYYAYDIQMLNPSESYAYSFVISLPKDVAQPLVRNIGHPEVQWAATLGEGGTYVGSDSIPFEPSDHSSDNTNSANTNNESSSSSSSSIISAESVGMKISCVSSPSTSIVGRPFDVVIRVSNNSRQNMSVRLTHRTTSSGSSTNSGSSNTTNNSTDQDMNGLTIIGISTMNIGVIPVGGYVEKTLLVYPSSSGLQELRDIIVIDATSGKEYNSGSLLKVLVNEQQDVGDV